MNSFLKGIGANGNRAVFSLPSFFVIGPPRTGPTWLHGILSQCAWLSHPTKETRFFDTHFDRGLDWYRSHYRRATHGRIIGEIAPTYFASPKARERIARLIPHAKVVCTFRDPVDRIFSLYRLKRAYGLIPWEFDEALVRGPELVDSSRYAAHLKEWKRTFGDGQILATLYDEMRNEPQSYLDRLADFLELPRLRLLPSQIYRALTSEDMTEPRYYRWTRGASLLVEWSKARRLDSFVSVAKRLGAQKLFVGGGPVFADLSSIQRARLRQIFRPEIDALEAMLNRDFSNWKAD